MENINKLSNVKNNRLYYEADLNNIKDLIKKGININNLNIYDENALFYSHTKDIKMKLLIDCGININQANIDGNTILLRTMIKNQRFINNKIRKGKRNIEEAPRIYEVSAIPIDRYPNEQQREMLIELLINSGSDLNHTNKIAENALFYSNYNISKLLINKKININQINIFGENALFFADIDVCKLLIKNGINQKQKNIDNKTFLDYLNLEEIDNLKFYCSKLYSI